MTQVFVGILGPESQFPVSGLSNLKRKLSQTLTDCPEAFSVEYWFPNQRPRSLKADRNILVLLVGDWRRLTKGDFFTGTEALALSENGILKLITVTASRFFKGRVPPYANLWQYRCAQLWIHLSRKAIRTTGPKSKNSFEDQLVKELIHEIANTTFQRSRAGSTSAVKLFLSYSHQDEDLCDKLARHLVLLERTGLIESWHDRQTVPGTEWSLEIDSHLYAADLILLLLSSDFFASEYCAQIETPVAIARHEANAARAIPVVLRPVLWQHSDLAKLEALPTDARPVTSWTSLDSAFVNICEGIVNSALSWSGKKSPVKPPNDRLFSLRKRVVDVALPSEVEVERSAMLVVLIRKSTSVGLRGLVAEDPTYGIEPKDVHSTSTKVRFPVTPEGKTASVELSVVLTAFDFDPPHQRRSLTLFPSVDSLPLIFIFAARHEGAIRALVEIWDNDKLIAACPVTTVAVSYIRARKPTHLACIEIESTDAIGEPDPSTSEESSDVSNRRDSSVSGIEHQTEVFRSDFPHRDAHRTLGTAVREVRVSKRRQWLTWIPTIVVVGIAFSLLRIRTTTAPMREAMHYLEIGTESIAKGDNMRAIEACTHVLEFEPDNATALTCRAQAYHSQGADGLAFVDINRIQNPVNPNVQRLKAQIRERLEQQATSNAFLVALDHGKLDNWSAVLPRRTRELGSLQRRTFKKCTERYRTGDVGCDYDSTFEKAATTEIVVLRKSPDESWKVDGYGWK